MIGEKLIATYYDKRDYRTHCFQTDRGFYVYETPRIHRAPMVLYQPHLVAYLDEYPIHGREVIEIKLDDVEYDLAVRLSGDWVILSTRKYDPFEQVTSWLMIVSSPEEFHEEWQDEYDADFSPVSVE